MYIGSSILGTALVIFIMRRAPAQKMTYTPMGVSAFKRSSPCRCIMASRVSGSRCNAPFFDDGQQSWVGRGRVNGHTPIDRPHLRVVSPLVGLLS